MMVLVFLSKLAYILEMGYSYLYIYLKYFKINLLNSSFIKYYYCKINLKYYLNFKMLSRCLKCNFCDKEFKTISYLNFHQKTSKLCLKKQTNFYKNLTKL